MIIIFGLFIQQLTNPALWPDHVKHSLRKSREARPCMAGCDTTDQIIRKLPQRGFATRLGPCAGYSVILNS